MGPRSPDRPRSDVKLNFRRFPRSEHIIHLRTDQQIIHKRFAYRSRLGHSWLAEMNPLACTRHIPFLKEGLQRRPASS
jgi:hypothetical protein